MDPKTPRNKHVLFSPKSTTSTSATQLQESSIGQIEVQKKPKQRPSIASFKQKGFCSSATVLTGTILPQVPSDPITPLNVKRSISDESFNERNERNKKWNEINNSCQSDSKDFIFVHQNDVLANITFLLIQRHVHLYSSELFQELYQRIELLFNDNEFLKLIHRDYVSVVDIKEFITTNNFLLNLPNIPNTSIYVSEHTGPRSRMEDSTSFIEDIYQFANIPKNNETDTMKYIGLFDGHLGSGASYYSYWSIPYRICSSNLSDISKALRNSFIETDNSLTQLTKSFKFNCGTTAVCSVITNTHIYTANVGDSEAYLCCVNEPPKQLTYKHLADTVDEKERIQSSGGKIFNLKGSRVEGLLQVTRGIGDSNMKKYIIPEPYLSTHTLTGDEEFLLLASDGLFNVVPPAVACCIVRSLLAEIVPDVLINHEIPFPINKQEISNWLVEYALERGSMDNVSVVILYF
ncbi:Protein phosphatase 1E [Entamoeba marina]